MGSTLTEGVHMNDLVSETKVNGLASSTETALLIP